MSELLFQPVEERRPEDGRRRRGRWQLVQANGTWNITPTVVGDGTWAIVASAPDPAGNLGTATQTLTIAAATPTGTGDTGTTDAPGTTQAVAPPIVPAASSTPLVTPMSPAPSATGLTSTAATTTVARNATQKLAGSRLSIATKVTAPAKGSVLVRATGSVKIAGIRKAIKLTTTTTKIPAGKTLTLKLKPKGNKKTATAAFKKIKTAVKKGKKVTATITLKITDAAGNTRTAKRTVKLTK